MMLILAIWGLCLVALIVGVPISFALQGDWVGVGIFLGLYVLVAGGMIAYNVIDTWRVRRWRVRRYGPTPENVDTPS